MPHMARACSSVAVVSSPQRVRVRVRVRVMVRVRVNLDGGGAGFVGADREEHQLQRVGRTAHGGCECRGSARDCRREARLLRGVGTHHGAHTRDSAAHLRELHLDVAALVRAGAAEGGAEALL